MYKSKINDEKEGIIYQIQQEGRNSNFSKFFAPHYYAMEYLGRNRPQ